MKSQDSPTRVVFTEGGKGGVGKTEIAINLATWYRSQGITPRMFDFDAENTEKSGLENFMPEATKLDVHASGALDHFFEVCTTDTRVVLADLGAGAGEATYNWFRKMYRVSRGMNFRFTAVGVTSNDPDSVISILQWGAELQRRVDYLVVLNEGKDPDESFEHWHENPAAQEFVKTFDPCVMSVESRIREFQTELRNQEITLDDVINGRTKSSFFKNPMQIVRAQYYRDNLFEGFDAASEILLASSKPSQD